MTPNAFLQKATLRWFLRQWGAWLVAGLCSAAYLFSESSPRDSYFSTQETITRLLKLFLGAVYLAAHALPTLLGAIVIGIAVFAIIVILRLLLKQRRWPTLIPVSMLIALNFMLIGAPNYVLSRSLGPRDIRCEFFVTEQTGLRLIRYPLDIERTYAEQQFLMMSFDGGESWGQFAQNFVYEPFTERCEGVEFKSDLDGTIIIETSTSQTETEYVTYETHDGGQNWEIVSRQQP